VFKIRAGVRAESALTRFDGGVVVGGVDGGVVVGGVAIMIEDELPVAWLAGPTFPAISATVFAASRGVIVPLDTHVTDTESADPCDADDADGVKTQPIAVPALTKSAPVMPETFSLKLVVNENG
jgi:hypothetical protein